MANTKSRKVYNSAGEVQCSVCKHYYPNTSEYFVTAKDCKDGLSSRCKACRRKKRSDQWIVRNPKKIYDEAGQLQCNACGSFFPATVEFFDRRRECSDGIVGTCKTCTRGQAEGIKG
jgi:hypothetical protein